MARQAFFPKLFFYCILGGDSRVVYAGNPQSFVSLHPFASDNNILHCKFKSVAHMELTGNVGRSDAGYEFGVPVPMLMFHWIRPQVPPSPLLNALATSAAGRQIVRIKKSALFPEFVNFVLNFFGVVGLLKLY